MDMAEAQAIARRFIEGHWPTDVERWSADSGITGVGVGYDPPTKAFYLGVNVVDEPAKAKISSPFEGLDVMVTVLGPTAQLRGPAAAEMDPLLDVGEPGFPGFPRSADPRTSPDPGTGSSRVCPTDPEGDPELHADLI